MANQIEREKNQGKIFGLNIRMRLINHVILGLVTLALYFDFYQDCFYILKNHLDFFNLYLL